MNSASSWSLSFFYLYLNCNRELMINRPFIMYFIYSRPVNVGLGRVFHIMFRDYFVCIYSLCRLSWSWMSMHIRARWSCDQLVSTVSKKIYHIIIFLSQIKVQILSQVACQNFKIVRNRLANGTKYSEFQRIFILHVDSFGFETGKHAAFKAAPSWSCAQVIWWEH